MTVVVQNDAGTVVDANAYIDVAYFKAYHDSRGNDYSAYDDTKVGAGIVRATDYADTRFTFKGAKLNASGQTTMWPRKAGSNGVNLRSTIDNDIYTPFVVIDAVPGDPVPLVDRDGNPITGIPEALKRATAEYTLRALAGGLFQDAPAPEGGRMIDSITQKVDVIEQSIKYADSISGAFVMPAYPAADLMLSRAGLIETSRTVIRA